MRKLNGLGTDMREMARLAGPIVFINIGIQLMGVADAVMVGRLGGAAIAAVALGNFYTWNASVFGIGLLFALDPVVAQAVGAGDDEGVARGVQRGIIMAVVVAVLVTLVMLPGDSVLSVLKQPPEVLPTTGAYLRRRALGVLPFFLFTVFRQTLQAMGPVRAILWAVLIANVVNIFGNWLLIFGNLGFPALGVVGSGYATAVSMWILMAIALVLSWPQLKTTLLPWRPESLRFEPIRRLVFIGAPVGVQWFFESFAFGLTALFMGWLGAVSLAGHEIALNMAALTYMVPVGFSGAAAAIVGRAVGRGDIERAKRDAITAIACSVGVMCVSALVFILAPEWLARLYTDEDATLRVAVALIPLAGAFQLFDGAQAVTSGVLRGTGDTRVPAILHLLAFWGVGVPVGAYLGFQTSLRERGFWWGLVAGLAAAAALQFWRLIVRFRGPIERLHSDTSPRPVPGDNPLPVG